ncbi:MAG: hypothetical protein H6631_06025 [Anaerolineaceae bacterium]|nr:hypothetical protein [Anaerolineaceae bacterium]
MTDLRGLILILSVLVWASACNFGPAGVVSTTPTAEWYRVGVASVGRGLETLDSYRAVYTATFTGTHGGQETSGVIKTEAAVDQRAGAVHRTMTIEADPPAGSRPGLSEFYRLDDKIYLVNGPEVIWFETQPGMAIAAEDVGFFDLSQLVVLPEQVAGPPETVMLNGRPARKVTFTAPDLTHPNLIFQQATGAVWLTEEENIVQQYELSASLRVVTPLPHAHILDEGQLQLTYALTGINAPLRLTPPQGGRPNRLVNLPRPADAEISAVYPALLEYTSAITPVSATLFYQNQLAQLGWTQVLTTVFEEKAHLAFNKGSQTATILINPDRNQKVKVVLSLE